MVHIFLLSFISILALFLLRIYMILTFIPVFVFFIMNVIILLQPDVRLGDLVYQILLVYYHVVFETLNAYIKNNQICYYSMLIK